MNDEPLYMWTIYDRPPDYPGHFVARRFVITPGEVAATEQAYFASTLEGVRFTLTRNFPGLTRLPRNHGDEAHIVETWL